MVDWLTWNLFKFSHQKRFTFEGLLNLSYHHFTSLSGVPQQWANETYAANYSGVAAWGLGAWGANTVKSFTHPNEADRVAWIGSAKAALNSRGEPVA